MKKAFGSWLVLVVLVSCAPVEEGALGRAEEELLFGSEPVGLSLFFRDGAATPITLIGDERRFLQELDISEQVVSATDDGIDPLLTAPNTASLDWSGVALVEEQVVPSLDGTFTRERYYRGARWMERWSRFRVDAIDASGRRVGPPIRFAAGSDDRWGLVDDGFVRRFNARQIAIGCPAPDDCTGATFIAEALVQVRAAVRPRWRARRISSRATELRVRWSAQPGVDRTVAVSHADRSSVSWGYGFSMTLEELSSPANGQFYEPGDTLRLRLTFRDGEGNRLHPPGSLPSYIEEVTGGTASGLQYLDLQLPTRLYYALKHRESNLMVGISGPLDQLQTPQTVVDPLTFFLAQTQFAFAGVDGYTAAIQTVPSSGIIFGGFTDPSVWSAPVSDEVTFTIPADAQPGTYLAALKARRNYGGEALNRGATLRFQVGQATATPFVASTTCTSCHSYPGVGFDAVLHGLDEPASCFGCHSSLGIELDNAIDIRVHRVHALSDRYPADINDCSTCHLSTPTGPQRL